MTVSAGFSRFNSISFRSLCAFFKARTVAVGDQTAVIVVYRQSYALLLYFVRKRHVKEYRWDRTKTTKTARILNKGITIGSNWMLSVLKSSMKKRFWNNLYVYRPYKQSDTLSQTKCNLKKVETWPWI